MSTQVTISGSTYSIPNQGQSPPWGEDLSDLLSAMVSLLTSLQGSFDVVTTAFGIVNNQATPANVTGLSFNTSQVRSAIISYSAYRSTNSSELSEAGQVYATYKSAAGTWEIAQASVGSSGITLTITSSGQFQYVSTNMSGTSYVGKLTFKAIAFAQ